MSKITDKKMLKEQRIITKYIFEGLSNEEIARKLKYSISTISNRTVALFRKYNAKTRLQFVVEVLSEIISNHRSEIEDAKEEINTLKEKIKYSEVILSNVINSRNDTKRMERWLKSAKNYLRS